MLSLLARLLRERKLTIDQFAVLAYLLERANWQKEDYKQVVNGHRIAVKQAQVVITARHLAKVVGTSPRSVTRALDTLKRLNLIATASVQKGLKGYTVIALNMEIFKMYLDSFKRSGYEEVYRDILSDCVEDTWEDYLA